jgi:hypothetical protein
MEKDNGINKSIRSSMNDDLLGEGDKKTAEVAESVSGGVRESAYVWDDKKGRYVPRGVAQRKKQHQQSQEKFDWDDDKEFGRAFGGDMPVRDRGVDPYRSRKTAVVAMDEIVLTNKQVSDVVDEMMRSLAVLNDTLGIVWSSEGVIELRSELDRLVTSQIYVAMSDGTYKKSVTGGL